MARYGQAYKDRIVARLLPPESSAVDVVSREVGVSVATLERWRADALANGAGDRRGGGGQRWTATARLSSSMGYKLPTFVNRLAPVAEVTWSSPASKPNDGDSTKYLFAVGLNYTEKNYSFAVEALIPGNKETGSHLGVIA